MKALHPVQPETYITGYIQPERYLLFLPLQRVGVGQMFQNSSGVEVFEKLRLRSLRNGLQIINLPIFQTLLDVDLVLFENEKIH